MIVTDAELAKDVDRYLTLAETQEISITRDGKVVATLSKPKYNKVLAAKALYGVIPPDITIEEARDERLGKK